MEPFFRVRWGNGVDGERDVRIGFMKNLLSAGRFGFGLLRRRTRGEGSMVR